MLHQEKRNTGKKPRHLQLVEGVLCGNHYRIVRPFNSRFFHVFNEEGEKEPLATLNLRKAKLNPKKETRFELVEVKKGFIGSK